MKRSVVLLALCLTGCYSFKGPQPVYDSRGVVAAGSYGLRNGPLFLRFETAANAAAACEQVSPPPKEMALCNTNAAPNQDVMRAFMRSGYALIYADCDNYFAEMGRNQSRSRILRAAVAPITTVLTGLIGLHTFADAKSQRDALTLLSLTSSAASSGLDIFDENFLFGANNIDAVRQLISNALTTHAQRTLANTDLTFEQASIDILDNEAICRPSQIMMLTRQAIANGNVEPRTTGEPNPKPKQPDNSDQSDNHGQPAQPGNNANNNNNNNVAPPPQKPVKPAGSLESTSVSVPR